MRTYRKRKGSDTWHWCKNCANWPIFDYDEVIIPDRERPTSGELDNECRTKEREGNCRK